MRMSPVVSHRTPKSKCRTFQDARRRFAEAAQTAKVKCKDTFICLIYLCVSTLCLIVYYLQVEKFDIITSGGTDSLCRTMEQSLLRQSPICFLNHEPPRTCSRHVIRKHLRQKPKSAGFLRAEAMNPDTVLWRRTLSAIQLSTTPVLLVDNSQMVSTRGLIRLGS